MRQACSPPTPAISVTVSITFQTVQKATLAEAFDLQGTHFARVLLRDATSAVPVTQHPRFDCVLSLVAQALRCRTTSSSSAGRRTLRGWSRFR